MRVIQRATFVLFLIGFGACEKRMPLPTTPTTGTQPPPPSSTMGGVGGYVTSVNGCVVGARVEVLDGPRAGEAVQQKDCPYGDAYGYFITDLPLGKMVTIRASASGYKPADKQVTAVEQVPPTNFTLTPE
jgi:hypothetical protein